MAAGIQVQAARLTGERGHRTVYVHTHQAGSATDAAGSIPEGCRGGAVKAGWVQLPGS